MFEYHSVCQLLVRHEDELVKRKRQLHPLIQTTGNYWAATLFQGIKMNKQVMHILVSYCYITHNSKTHGLEQQLCTSTMWRVYLGFDWSGISLTRQLCSELGLLGCWHGSFHLSSCWPRELTGAWSPHADIRGSIETCGPLNAKSQNWSTVISIHMPLAKCSQSQSQEAGNHIPPRTVWDLCGEDVCVQGLYSLTHRTISPTGVHWDSASPSSPYPKSFPVVLIDLVWCMPGSTSPSGTTYAGHSTVEN